MASGDIVPIELGLTDGDLVTLWAPHWRDGDDEWEAFLGYGDALYGFDTVAELAAFIRTNTDNDLSDHPAWKIVVGLSAAELEPEDTFRFDVVGVPELVAGDPDAETVTELEDTLSIVRSLGEVCDLEVVTGFFAAHPVLAMASGGPDNFLGREGAELWDQLGTAVAQDWDGVLDAIDALIASPEVPADALAGAEAELLAAEENVVDADDLVADEDEDDYEPVDLDEDEDESLWHAVGIDPIKIVTADGDFFTLRCYLGDEPLFLGRKGKITVCDSERELARYLADATDHDLAQVSTYDEVQTAATDGSLRVEVTEENVYVLPGLAEDLAAGPESVDVEQLDLAVELFVDAADYAGDDTVEQALAASTPLGWYVSYLLNPDPTRMAPSAPFTEEAHAWRELEAGVVSRLTQA